MPAIAHRNCRLPGKTRAAIQLRKLRDIKWRDQPQNQGHSTHTRDGIGRKQRKKPSHMFKLNPIFSRLPLENSPIQQKGHKFPLQSHLRDLTSRVSS